MRHAWNLRPAAEPASPHPRWAPQHRQRRFAMRPLHAVRCAVLQHSRESRPARPPARPAQSSCHPRWRSSACAACPRTLISTWCSATAARSECAGGCAPVPGEGSSGGGSRWFLPRCCQQASSMQEKKHHPCRKSASSMHAGCPLDLQVVPPRVLRLHAAAGSGDDALLLPALVGIFASSIVAMLPACLPACLVLTACFPAWHMRYRRSDPRLL